MKNTALSCCPLCGGEKREGQTTFTADLQETVVVVRGVPATVCALCGNEWISDQVAEVLENIVEGVKTRHPLVEVTQYPKVA